MSKYELIQNWFYDRLACDCCDGLYEEVWKVYKDGLFLFESGSEVEAKAAILDTLEKEKDFAITLEIIREDYLEGFQEDDE